MKVFIISGNTPHSADKHILIHRHHNLPKPLIGVSPIEIELADHYFGFFIKGLEFWTGQKSNTVPSSEEGEPLTACHGSKACLAALSEFLLKSNILSREIEGHLLPIYRYSLIFRFRKIDP